MLIQLSVIRTRLMLLCLQFSVRLSRLTYRMRKLTRQVALLQEELAEQRAATEEDAAHDDEGGRA